MTETDLITVGEPLPTLAHVAAGDGPYTVVVSWAEGARVGRTDAIDLAPIVLTLKAFRPLRDDPTLFATVRLSAYADAIEWGPDDALALSGSTLERLAEETMTSADLAAFMARHELSYDATAAHLGISRRLVAYYLKTLAIPRTVALACKYLDGALGGSEAA